MAVAVCALVLTVGLRGAIECSAFGVLLYYFVASLAALSQDDEHRRCPRALQVAGSGGCVLLGLTAPVEALLTDPLVLVAAVICRLVRRRSGRLMVRFRPGTLCLASGSPRHSRRDLPRLDACHVKRHRQFTKCGTASGERN